MNAYSAFQNSVNPDYFQRYASNILSYFIGDECSKNQIELYIDAEYSHLQPAVRLLTLCLMKIYNLRHPTIFNTYQCYLKNSLTTIENDMKVSRQLDFHFGCKIVRGAYLKSEIERHSLTGGEFPIHNSYENTNNSYNK